MSSLTFVERDSPDFAVIAKIGSRAATMAKKHGDPTGRARLKLHHEMNVSACHGSGNPLRLRELLAADDFNFAHDVFGIDMHIDRATGQLTNHFLPRYSARSAASANARPEGSARRSQAGGRPRPALEGQQT